ncbi:MAG: hypothetical protein AAB649_06090 [Patescibacteria group bacterium]
MVTSGDFKELLYTVSLIAGFSIAGLIVGMPENPRLVEDVAVISEKPHAVSLVANPVVHITVPAHNIFAK